MCAHSSLLPRSVCMVSSPCARFVPLLDWIGKCSTPQAVSCLQALANVYCGLFHYTPSKCKNCRCNIIWNKIRLYDAHNSFGFKPFYAAYTCFAYIVYLPPFHSCFFTFYAIPIFPLNYESVVFFKFTCLFSFFCLARTWYSQAKKASYL